MTKEGSQLSIYKHVHAHELSVLLRMHMHIYAMNYTHIC